MIQIVGSVLVLGCVMGGFMMEGGHILALWQGTVIAAAVVGIIVWSLIIWSVVRYRRSNDDIPNQNPYNIPIEILYTVVPVAIVGALFFFTLRTQHQTYRLSKHPDVTVEVIGFQWQWQFHYPAEGVTVTGTSTGRPPEMVLPVGATVRLKLRSTDVNHSFWVPRFLSKRDLIPGLRNQLDVNVSTPGTFKGRCAEFCGLDHWRMNFDVRAVNASEYRSWIQRHQPPQRTR